jgi:hypothetical protein
MGFVLWFPYIRDQLSSLFLGWEDMVMISRLIVILSIIMLVALSPALVCAQYSEAPGANRLPTGQSSYGGPSNCGTTGGYSGICAPHGYFPRGIPPYREPVPWLSPQLNTGNFRDGTY